MKRAVFNCWIKAIPIAAALACSGCIFSSSPYDSMENWLIRDDPACIFDIPADVIYVQSRLYLKMGQVQDMRQYAFSAVGHNRFVGVARVFSPLVASAEDMEKAVAWYLKHHHQNGRPFIFIGEGDGGRLLQEYEIRYAKKLLDKGLVASFYAPSAQRGFVSDRMLQEIKKAIERAHYRSLWGREMPAGMQD